MAKERRRIGINSRAHSRPRHQRSLTAATASALAKNQAERRELNAKEKELQDLNKKLAAAESGAEALKRQACVSEQEGRSCTAMIKELRRMNKDLHEQVRDLENSLEERAQEAARDAEAQAEDYINENDYKKKKQKQHPFGTRFTILTALAIGVLPTNVLDAMNIGGGDFNFLGSRLRKSTSFATCAKNCALLSPPLQQPSLQILTTSV